MKIFPQNAFPLPIIAHPKKNGHFLELLKKISVLKKNIGFLPEPFSPLYDWGSQWFVCRKSGQVMAVAHGPGAGAGPLLEHSRFGEQGCEKVSQNWCFSYREAVLAQKCKMSSAGHQSLILGYFHDCSPPSLQTQPDWVWAGLFPTGGFPAGAVALLWFCGRAATMKIN